MAVTVAEIKEYCHAEGESNAVMTAYVNMAADYLTGAGVRESWSPADTYALALKALTLHFYDNRGGGAVPAGLDGMITQLQFRQTEPEPEVDADDTD